MICNKCHLSLPLENFHKHPKTNSGRIGTCKPCFNASARTLYKGTRGLYLKNYYRQQRIKCLDHYSNGTFKCVCCNESRYEFLAIDHINGNGNKQRKEVGNIVTWLVKNKYPDGYQVLCHNCNMAKGLYGECPHITELEIESILNEDLYSV